MWKLSFCEKCTAPTCVLSQAVSEQLAAKKDEVAEAIRNTQVFLLSKQAGK